MAVLVLLLLLSACGGRAASAGGSSTLSYDQLILSAKPILFLAMDTPSKTTQIDLSGHGHNGVYLPAAGVPKTAAMPNGDLAADFNGTNQYLQVANSPDLSVSETGVLTLEAWIRPDTLQPSHDEGTGYVNFLGKSSSAASTSASTRCACTRR